ncbi:MAG: response regulator [Candidatus Omnitrophica bacterium]|nr:response regulator [Candidatus Omnitrophota bacterium]
MTTNRIKVLVVDDKKVIGDFFDFTLGYFGHEITVVHDPREAAKAAQQKDFDIAFLDIMMPEKNGVDVLKEIKSVLPQLPVVMMSGYSLQEMRDKAVEFGACGCLKKPFELDDVRQVMKTALGKSIE